MSETLKKILSLGIGGFAGSNARYWISCLMEKVTGGCFPTGTLTVNAIGCFLLGLLSGSSGSWNISPNFRLLLGTGFLGALTTFSTFSVETLTLFQKSSPVIAFLNLLFNIVLGFSAAYLGILITRQ